jgi:hypothetical protein
MYVFVGDVPGGISHSILGIIDIYPVLIYIFLLVVYIVSSMVMHVKTPKIIRTLMESKMALYVLVALSVMNVLGYMMNNCARAVIFFFLVGAVAYGFTHNMVCVLSACLFLTTMLVTCGPSGPLAHNDYQYVEGMEDNTGSDESEEKPDTSSDETDNATGDDAVAKAEPAGANAAPDAAPATKESCPKTWNETTKTCGAEKESMTTVYKKNNRIDAAATVEDAYDDLNKILGGSGMKNLTKDTQSLVTQQKDLTEAMKSMGPLMDQAASMMGQMGGKDGIGSMLKKFSNAAPVGK